MIGLIGYGYWGKILARIFQLELTAICDNNLLNLKQAQGTYPEIKSYENYDAFINDSNIKAVLIATDAKSHFNIAKKCLESNKDIWVEKPLCNDLEEIKILKEISEKYKKNIFVDYTFCFHPAVIKMKTIDIGTPLYYDSTRVSLGIFRSDTDVLLDLAIHDLAIVNFLYPNLQIISKNIQFNNHINDHPNQVIINLKFDNNFTVSINANWVSPLKKRQIILTGKKKSIVYDDIDVDKVRIYDTGNIDIDYNANQLGGIQIPKISTVEALYNARVHFLNCIKNKDIPITGVEESLKIMRWVL